LEELEEKDGSGTNEVRDGGARRNGGKYRLLERKVTVRKCGYHLGHVVEGLCRCGREEAEWQEFLCEIPCVSLEHSLSDFSKLLVDSAELPHPLLELQVSCGSTVEEGAVNQDLR